MKDLHWLHVIRLATEGVDDLYLDGKTVPFRPTGIQTWMVCREEWEIARGLDPNNKEDRNGDYDNDGYTNLEEYLNDVGAFPAVQAIKWDGKKDNRYANILNWDIAFQPSRFDTVVISNDSAVVDAIDQHAGVLRLTNSGIVNITDGWLDIAIHLDIEKGSYLDLGDDGILIADDMGAKTTSSVVNISVIYTNPTSIHKNKNEFDIEVYPVPVSNSLYAKINKAVTGHFNISLFDIRGKIVKTVKTNTSSNTIDTGSLPDSLYIVRITGNEINTAKYISKQ